MPSKSARKRQVRLSFTPLPSSSPAAKDYNPQIRDRAAAVILEGSPRPSKSRRKMNNHSDAMAIDLSDEPAMPTPAASRNAVVEIDSDDELVRASQRQPHERGMRRARQQKLDFSGARDALSFDTPMTLPSSSVRTRASKPGMFGSSAKERRISISSDNSDDSAGSDILPSPRKSTKRSGKGKETGQHKSTAGGAENEEEALIASPHPTQEESEDEMPTTLGKQPRKRRQSVDSFISDSPSPPPDSDDDVIVVRQKSKKRARQESEEEEEEDDLPKTPGRRRLKRPRQFTAQEKEELEDDLEFLQPSSEGEEPIRQPRSSQSAQKSARQQALEKLKQKRSSQLQPVEEGNEREEDTEQQGEDELYDNDDDVIPQVARARQMFTRNEEDDDFVEEEDEENPLGVPEGMPLQFTTYASMKPSQLFEFAVEWMVQRKINPAFQMNDEIYELTFKKLDDEVRGLAASKFTSSAWTSAFTLALQARPEIAYEAIDRNSSEHWMRDKCDACNRSGHPATYQIQFQGKPYNWDTLEPVANGDDEDDSDSSESEGGDNDERDDVDNRRQWDSKGREIEPISTIWYVGKFCKGNAQTGHALHHWKHHLNGFVEEYLEEHGYCTAEQLVKRDRWSTKKRRKYANKVVDQMKKEGSIKDLWRQFKDNIEQARDAKQGRYDPDSP